MICEPHARAYPQGVHVSKEVAAAVDGALREDGSVKESASEEVRRTRGRVSTLQGRLRGILQNQPGEVTEQVGNIVLTQHGCDNLQCVASTHGGLVVNWSVWAASGPDRPETVNSSPESPPTAAGAEALERTVWRGCAFFRQVEAPICDEL